MSCSSFYIDLLHRVAFLFHEASDSYFYLKIECMSNQEPSYIKQRYTQFICNPNYVPSLHLSLSSFPSKLLAEQLLTCERNNLLLLLGTSSLIVPNDVTMCANIVCILTTKMERFDVRFSKFGVRIVVFV